MAVISESACRAQLRHHDPQVVAISTALLIHVLPNGLRFCCPGRIAADARKLIRPIDASTIRAAS
jgi:hypothetical protein